MNLKDTFFYTTRPPRSRQLRSSAFPFLLIFFIFFVSGIQAQPLWQSAATSTGSGNSVTVNKPAGLAADDLMVMGIAFSKGSTINISATGWTLIQRTNQGNNHGFASYYKIATAADVTASNIAFSVTAAPTWVIGVSRITAFDATNPINVSDGAISDAASTNVVAPSITTTEGNTLLLAFYSNDENATFTPAVNTTEQYDVPRAGGPSNMMATYVQTPVGATGPKTAVSSVSSSWVAQQVAINPLPFIFRSRQTGDWNATDTWEQSDGAGGWVNTAAFPQSGQQATIQPGHTVSVTANQATGNTTVAAGGVLVVNTGISLSIPTTMALTVNGTLRMPGTSVVDGAGNFSLSAGATIEIGSVDGITSTGVTGNIQVTGTRSFSTTANYTYNGTAQQVTGNGFPGAANNITIDNPGGLNAQADITVNGVLNLASANPNATDGTLDMVKDYSTSGLPLPDNGGYLGYAATSTNTLDAINVTNQRTQGGDILNSYILHMGPTATTIGQGDVTGRVKRETIAANTAYTFGSQYTTITFSSAGTLPTAVMFVITKGPDKGIHPNKINTVQRLYQVIRTGGAIPNTFSVQFRYLSSELNGNTAGNLVLWDHHIPYNSTNTPHEHGKTTQSTTEHWVGLSGHSITYIADKEEISPTSFTKYWMFGNTLIVGNKWLGAVQNDWTNWNNLSNWTAGNVPIATDNVIIPGTGITHWPELPNNAVAKSVTIESGGQLDGGSGTLTLKGGITNAGGVGSWNNNGTFNAGTSSVVFDFVRGSGEETATISGETVFNNVSVTADTYLVVQAGSDIDIKGSLTNSGNIDATTFNNTIGYDGPGLAIINPNGGSLGYRNLRLGSSLSGATWPTAFSVAGNLINNRESLAIPGTLTLNGSGQVQNLGGTHPTSFENLTVNNAAGISLGQSQSVTGALDLTSGVVATGANTLTMTGNINNASASSYVNGLLARNFTGIGSKAFPVGSAANYHPKTLEFTAFNCTDMMVTAQFVAGPLPGTLPSEVALYDYGYWQVTQSGCSESFAFKISLEAAGFSPTQDEKAVILKKDNTTITSHPTTTPWYTNAVPFNSFSEFGLGELTLLTWTGGTSVDWSVGSNWDLGVVPQATDDALIPGVLAEDAVYPLVTAPIISPSAVNNLTIASGAKVNIGPGNALTVHGDLLNQAGVGGLIIESNADGTGSLQHNTFNVDATLQRYISGASIPVGPSITPATLYHTVSVPLTQASDPRSSLFLDAYLYRFDAFNQVWFHMGSSLTNELESSRGYMIYFPAASKTYSFAGPMNSGSFEKAVVYGVDMQPP
jgi:hypothetical protein